MRTLSICTPVLMALGFALWLPSRSPADEREPVTFVKIDVPGASSTGSSAPNLRLKINPESEIVGGYLDAAGKVHGFLLKDDTFTTIDYPGATFTTLNAINPQGDIVGNYVAASKVHGLLQSEGNLTTIDVPGATLTVPFGINARGEIAGVYSDAGGRGHGFVLNRGTISTIDCPGAVFTSSQGINAEGDVVGFCMVGGRGHGYLLSQGVFTAIDVPGSTSNVAIDFSPEEPSSARSPRPTALATATSGAEDNSGPLTCLEECSRLPVESIPKAKSWESTRPPMASSTGSCLRNRRTNEPSAPNK